MSDNTQHKLGLHISATAISEIDEWIAKYPVDQKQSAVMSALRIIQEEHSYLTPEIMTDLAGYLGMPPIAVFEIANFYTMYEREPVGRHVISVCTNISCQLRNSAEIVNHLEKTLNIKLGETTEDNRFTVRAVECLGACVNAPMMQIDKTYHECLTTTKVDDILKEYE